MTDPRRGRSAVLRAAAAAGLAAGAIGGCGAGAPTLGTRTIETAVAESILVQHGVRTAVQCPRGVARRAGVVFTCTVRLDAGSYPVTVTENDGHGRVRYESRAPLALLQAARVERAIAAAILAQRHLRAHVSCPATILQQAGLRFSCLATIGARSYPFDVSEVNAAGRVRFVGR
jgi:hypothetical protein